MLPGANPVQAPCYEEYTANYTPAILSPVHVSSTAPNKTGAMLIPATTTNVTQTAEGTCIRPGAGERVEVGWLMITAVGIGLLYEMWIVL